MSAELRTLILNLAASFDDENARAYDLWSWLPSRKIAEKYHGSHASNFTPSIASILEEATFVLSERAGYEHSAAERAEFASCPCGDGCERREVPVTAAGRIAGVFGKTKVFLPVIHPISRDHALRALDAARDGGADGVFLINQGMSAGQTLALLDDILVSAELWVGVNILGSNVQSLVDKFQGRFVPGGIWSDRSEPLFARRGWDGLYFGGVSFKYQPEVRPEDEEREVRRARESALVDVVTTSGPGTGEAADLDKVRRMKSFLGDAPLAIASGITVDNVRQYTPYTDAFLVATGVERELGVFDLEKLRRVADAIHEM